MNRLKEKKFYLKAVKFDIQLFLLVALTIVIILAFYFSPLFAMGPFIIFFVLLCSLHTKARTHEIIFEDAQTAFVWVEVIDKNTFRFIRNNRYHQHITGISANHLKGKSPVEVAGKDMGGKMVKRFQQCMQTHSPLSYEETFFSPEGERIWSITLIPVVEEDKRVNYILILSREVTERKKAEKEWVNLEVTKARNLERNRLSKDLHDELGMNLTTIKLNLQMLNNGVENKDFELQHKLASSLELIDNTLQSIRNVSNMFEPPRLEEADFVDLISKMVHEFSQANDIKAKLNTSMGPASFSTDIKVAIYRCIQEMLSNVARHAGADKVEIDIMWDTQQVSVRVKDNGNGFNKDTKNLGSHKGLKGIEDRLSWYGGNININTLPGQGTEIIIMVPLLEKKRGQGD